jgi:cation diffusion facilitator CzcD-associated flavoprotein CzcO
MLRARRSVRIAIAGAGLGGVATAVKLKRAGITSFTVFERKGGAGGVWRQNTYPGCEVDVPSHAYSFSFMSYDWSGTHAKAPELERYVQDVIDEYQIREHFVFGCGIDTAIWSENRGAYIVVTDDGQQLEFDVVVSCVGMLSDVNWPQLPGLDSFAGPVFHTSAYEHEHDLATARVGVIGTGSTACQLVPALAPQVKHLRLFQREPGYVLPKPSRPYTADERVQWVKHPWRQKWDRFRLFRGARRVRDAFKADSDYQTRRRKTCQNFIAKTIDDPELRKTLTPDYPFGCKRPIFASDFYPSLNSDNVSVTPYAVVEVVPDGVIDADGTFHELDVLILATGFKATDYLRTLNVRGRGGRSLKSVWAGEPSAFLGMTVPGFPNFFIVYGPNTNGGWSVMTQLERQAEVIARVAGKIARGRADIIDTRSQAAAWFDSWVQRQIADKLSSTTAGACHNYYHSASGKNVTQWPLSHTAYGAALRVLPLWGFVTTRYDRRRAAEPIRACADAAQ